MTTLSQDCVGVHPRVRPGLEALAGFLRDRDYTTTRIGHILDYVHRHGTLGELVRLGYLDREDEASAESEYVEALLAIAGPDASWQDESIWIDADSLMSALDRWGSADVWISPLGDFYPTDREVEEMNRAWDLDEPSEPQYGYE